MKLCIRKIARGSAKHACASQIAPTVPARPVAGMIVTLPMCGAAHDEPQQRDDRNLERDDLQREDPDVDPVASLEVDPHERVRRHRRDDDRDHRGRDAR